jgi:hypothetical protein
LTEFPLTALVPQHRVRVGYDAMLGTYYALVLDAGRCGGIIDPADPIWHQATEHSLRSTIDTRMAELGDGAVVMWAGRNPREITTLHGLVARVQYYVGAVDLKVVAALEHARDRERRFTRLVVNGS